MKKILYSIFVLFFLVANAYASDWREYGANDYGTFYYDRDSVVYGGMGNIIRFWGKRQHRDSENYTLLQYEFNCLHGTYRAVKCEIREKDSPEPKYCGAFDWEKIPTDTYTRDLYKSLCAKRGAPPLK